MMRDEFDANCSRQITDEDYKKVEFVYNYHPINFDKVAISKLVEEFGMCIIYDMLPRAQAAMEQEIKINNLRQELENCKTRLDKAKQVDMCSEDFIDWRY